MRHPVRSILKLAEPRAEVADPTDRARARMLSRALLAIGPVGVLAITVQLLSDPSFLPTFVSNLVTLCLLTLAAIIARTRHYRWAAAASTFIVVLACTSAGLLNADDPVWWAYTIIAVLMSTLLLSVRASALIATFAAVCVIGVQLYQGKEGQAFWGPLGYLIVTAPLLLMATYSRDHLEKQRLGLQQQLGEKQRLETVGRIAGGVAHDFNNLLTVMLTSAALARREDNPSDYLTDIEHAGQRAARLTQQLLAFARKQVLQPAELDLVGLVKSMEPVLRSAAQSYLELRVESPTLRVCADHSQLEQVLLNLVVNASDALEDHGHIDVSLRSGIGPAGTALAGQPCAELLVRDNGQGIDPKLIDHIFEPFVTTKAGDGGTGLGLATVEGIVNQSGGHIAVESTVGGGTTFRVHLPLMAESVAGETESVLAHQATEVSRVLLVDDQSAVLRTLQRMLELGGWEVLPALGPEAALKVWAAEQDTIDAVISDVRMPMLSGPELIKRLLQDRPGLRAVLISGDATPGDVLIESVGVPLLRKPFSLEELRPLLGMDAGAAKLKRASSA